MAKTKLRFGLRHPWAAIFSLLLCPLFCAAAPAADELPARVSDALRKEGISLQNVAVLVRSVDEEEAPILRFNTQKPMNPASVMKVLTTYVALEILGPAHTWKTRALADRLPVAGRLDGNLYLRGSGDPRLALEQFWLLLRQLRARGVEEITGDLILDRSAFSLPPHDPSEFDKQPLRPYNVGPDALLVNLKTQRFILHPEINDKTPAWINVFSETPGADALLRSYLTAGPGPCNDWRERLSIRMEGDFITLRGAYPIRCGEQVLNLSPWTANFQVEQIFRALWQELGGILRGQARDGITPPNAVALVTHSSPPFSESIREINKYSNNVMARQVFLALDTAQPATLDGARHVVLAWLSSKGLKMPELELENGSGLSHKERISAESLTRLLLAAWRSAVMPELISSLPLAGVDGTLQKLKGNPVVGYAHLKTGYLRNVRSLAGYVLDSGGKRWIVVFIINDPHAIQGRPAMEALLQWLMEKEERKDREKSKEKGREKGKEKGTSDADHESLPPLGEAISEEEGFLK